MSWRRSGRAGFSVSILRSSARGSIAPTSQGAIDAEERRHVSATNIYAHDDPRYSEGREGQICFVIGRSGFDADPGGCEPLLGTWGGEAMRRCGHRGSAALRNPIDRGRAHRAWPTAQPTSCFRALACCSSDGASRNVRALAMRTTCTGAPTCQQRTFSMSGSRAIPSTTGTESYRDSLAQPGPCPIRSAIGLARHPLLVNRRASGA